MINRESSLSEKKKNRRNSNVRNFLVKICHFLLVVVFYSPWARMEQVKSRGKKKDKFEMLFSFRY